MPNSRNANTRSYIYQTAFKPEPPQSWRNSIVFGWTNYNLKTGGVWSGPYVQVLQNLTPLTTY